MEPTIFDLILSKQIPADIVYEDDYVLGFRDVNPQAPVHVLFIPKIRINTHNDLNDENIDFMNKIHLAINDYAKEIGVADDGYRIVMNCNDHGGQTVFHIHMHFLAGRQLSWPPG